MLRPFSFIDTPQRNRVPLKSTMTVTENLRQPREDPRGPTDTPGEKVPMGPGGAALEGCLLAAVLVYVGWTRFLQPEIWIDDAFIHFRNARNFAEGQGLVFNPGEWVIGSTSPVYVFLLGLIGRLTGLDISLVGRGVNGLADIGAAGLCLFLLARAGVPRAFRYAIVFTVLSEPLGMVYSVAGMEMSLFIAASLLIVACADQGKWLPVGLVLGVLGWIRPEGVTVGFAVIVALAWNRRNGQALRTVAVASLVALVMGGILLFFYGTVLPQSLISKSTATWFPTLGEQDAVHFFHFLGRLGPLPALLSGVLHAEEPSTAMLRLGFAGIQLVLMGLGGTWWIRRAPVAGRALLGIAVFYFLFYAVTNPKLFEWYYVPLGFLGLLLGGVGWWALIERLIRFAVDHGEARVGSVPFLAAASAIAFGLILMLGQSNIAAESEHFIGEGRFERHGFRIRERDVLDRLNLYAQAGRVMESWRVEMPEAVASTPEIGVFAWYYRGKVLDPYALVSPEALDVLTSEGRAKLDDEARDYHPVNVYILHEPEFVMTSGLFLPSIPKAMAERYVEVPRQDVPFLRLFVRKDVPTAVWAATRKPLPDF